MGSLLIRGASYVITPETVKKDVDIYIEDGRIVEFKAQEADTVVEARNRVVMPGFVNLHTHISMTFLRGIAEDKELQAWLSEDIWPREAKLNHKIVYYAALIGIAEALRSGTTSFVDMYFFEKEVAKAAEKLGIRAWVGHGMIDLGDEEKREKEIKETIDLIKFVRKMGSDLVNPTIAPHSPYTCSRDLLEVCVDMAVRNGIPLQIHLSETRRELEEVKKKTGKTPLLYLNSIGFSRANVIAAHGVWLTPREIVAASKQEITIAHCPVSNLKLGSGIAPVIKYLERGVKVGLGTDGPASNNNLDMFEEIKTAALLQKLKDVKFSGIEALKMATEYGARALGMKGEIKEGAEADLIVLNIEKPHFMPVLNRKQVLNNVIYSARGSDVEYTIVNGEVVMRNGKVNLNLREIESKLVEEMKKAAI